MQASAPLNYSPCLYFFFSGRGVGVGGVILLCSSKWPGIRNLPASDSENQDSTPVLPHLGRVSPLTPGSPPSRKSLILPRQFITSNLKIPSVLRRMSFSLSGIKGKLGPALGVPELRHWLWPLSSSLPVPPGSTWWSLPRLIPPQSSSVPPHRPLWPLVTWTADKGPKRRENTFSKKGQNVRLSKRHSLCCFFFFSVFPLLMKSQNTRYLSSRLKCNENR